MIRETLQKMFPISQTIKERRETLGGLGFQKSNENYETAYGYIGGLPFLYVCKIGTFIGLTLYGYFCYLALREVDVRGYVSMTCSPSLQPSGLIGAYAYIYASIMFWVSLTLSALSFLLFLVHVKKGSVSFNNFDEVKYISDRTFLSFRNFFFSLY